MLNTPSWWMCTYIMIFKQKCSPPPRSTRKAFCTIEKKNRKKRKTETTEQTENTEKNQKRQPKDSGWDIPPPLFYVFSFCSVHAYFGNIFEKHFPLPAFGIHYFPKKTAFPKIFPAICFKLLSLKTGLFQGAVAFFPWRSDFFGSEVAPKEESSIWTNRLSVKQDFVYKEEGIIWTELVR